MLSGVDWLAQAHHQPTCPPTAPPPRQPTVWCTPCAPHLRAHLLYVPPYTVHLPYTCCTPAVHGQYRATMVNPCSSGRSRPEPLHNAHGPPTAGPPYTVWTGTLDMALRPLLTIRAELSIRGSNRGLSLMASQSVGQSVVVDRFASCCTTLYFVNNGPNRTVPCRNPVFYSWTQPVPTGCGPSYTVGYRQEPVNPWSLVNTVGYHEGNTGIMHGPYRFTQNDPE